MCFSTCEYFDDHPAMYYDGRLKFWKFFFVDKFNHTTRDLSIVRSTVDSLLYLLW